MRNNSPKLSIVIVNYMVDDLLLECIRSLKSQKSGRDAEIFIVDNGPAQHDDPVFDGTIVLDNRKNNGFAYANNLAMRKASGDYILLLNPDTIVKEGALDTCLRIMKERGDIGILGCKLLNEDGSLQSSCRNFPGLSNILAENLGLHRIIKKWRWMRDRYLMFWPHDSFRNVDSVKGAFMMIRKTVLESVGLLDEHFFMYCEEVDFCLRTRKQGWKIAFTPDARIVHLGGKSTEINSLKYLVELHKSYRTYCRKHFNPVLSEICIAVYFCGVALRVMANMDGLWSDDQGKRKKFRLFLETAKSYLR